MKKIALILITFTACILLTGCESWKSIFQVSELKVEDSSIVGKIRNTTNYPYELTITFAQKNGDIEEEDKAYITIKPNETYELDEFTNLDDSHEIKISNIEYKEIKEPKLKDGEIDTNTLKYHFRDIYENHTYNMLAFTTIFEDSLGKYPYMDTIEYDSDEGMVNIKFSFMEGTNYLGVDAKYETVLGDLSLISFMVSYVDSDFQEDAINSISQMKDFRDNSISFLKNMKAEETTLGYYTEIGYKWKFSSKYSRDSTIKSDFYYIEKQ